jgi:hypothetical protein
MDLMERTNERRRSFMKDRLEHKLDDAMKEKIRLEEANELLKQELDREQHDRDQMWSALQKGMRPQRSRFRRVLFLGAGVGAAYVYGAKAGRGRYEEMQSWWERMRGRASEMQDEAQRKISERTGAMGGSGGSLSDTGGMESGSVGMGTTGSSTATTRTSPTGTAGGTSSSSPSSSGVGTPLSTRSSGSAKSKDATTGDVG